MLRDQAVIDANPERFVCALLTRHAGSGASFALARIDAVSSAFLLSLTSAVSITTARRTRVLRRFGRTAAAFGPKL
jgi:hypothetical protein